MYIRVREFIYVNTFIAGLIATILLLIFRQWKTAMFMGFITIWFLAMTIPKRKEFNI